MLALNEYLNTIVPLLVTYFAIWFGYKVWKAKQKHTPPDTEGSDDQFAAAINFMGRQKGLSNDQRLVAYALYKQVHVGDCNIERPGVLDMIGGAKWDAWCKLKGLSKTDARQAYIEFAESLGLSNPNSQESSKSGGSGLGPVQSTLSELSDDRRQNFVLGEELFQASSVGDVVKMKKLIGEASHTILNSKDENGQTALHWACDRGQVKAVELLLSYPNISINEADHEGMTPLHYAVACEFTEVVKLLISAGADVNIEDNDGETPLTASEDNEEIKAMMTK